MTTKSAEFKITPISREKGRFFVLGTSGIYFNSMSGKAMRDLLFPPRKPTAAEKATRPKHHPRQEFESSIYRADEDAPTWCGFPASGFKSALATAALATPGITKTDVQKHLYVEGDILPIYGDPFLRMDVVRNSDINRTPDVRSRAFMPQWCAELTVSYTTPNFTNDGVTNLLANAGEIAGIGDFRQEKGRGNFGRWVLVNEGDPEWAAIVAETSRATQQVAMQQARPFDAGTTDLLDHWDTECASRGFTLAVAAE